MRNEFTAIIERDGEWFIAHCPEVPGANGQDRTIQECRKNLADAIELILEDQRQNAFRRAPADAIREVVENPWVAKAGMFVDDPTWEDFQQTMADYRRQVDENPNEP